MKNRYVLGLLLGLGILGGCYNEDDIVPREGGEKTFDFPQGNHAYDLEMVAYQEKYEFYPLYIFTDHDLYWNNTSWSQSGGVGNDGNYGLLGRCADTLYVGKQWDMCKRLFFENWPDSFLSDMPWKFLMCSELWNVEMNRRTYEYDTLETMVYLGYDCLAVNYGSEAIDTLSDASKRAFSQAVNAVFMDRENDRGKFETPEAFSTVSDYVYKYYSGYNSAEMFTKGYVSFSTLVSNNKTQSIMNDFAAFLPLVTTALDVLEAEPLPVGDYYSNYKISLQGLLHPTRDTEGKIRAKYEILIEYFKSLGIRVEKFQYPDLE